MKKQLRVTNKSIDVAGIKKDYKEAIIEYIWNGFDANAENININYTLNEFGKIDEILIEDDGEGIDYENIENTFGTFLTSEKETFKNLSNNIHGSKGKGRFSFASFAQLCTWNTIYKEELNFYEYSITINNDNKKEYDITEKAVTNLDKTGTQVIIKGIYNLNEEDITGRAFEECILNNFSWYLYLNKEKNYTITINNRLVDYRKFIDSELSEDLEIEIENTNFKVFFIKWNKSIHVKYFFYMLDEYNSQKHKEYTRYNNNAIDFYHSVYIKSSYFNSFEVVKAIELENQEYITTCEHTNKEQLYKKLLKELNTIVTNKCKNFLRNNSDKVICDLEEIDAFPKFPNDRYGMIRKGDLVSIVKEVYCVQPKIFKKANREQKKVLIGFLNLILDTEERDNIINIMDSIEKLTTEERENLSKLLKKTSLNNIVNVLKMLDDRNEIIEKLKVILYDGETYSTERDNIQKIIEENFWILGEQYHLVSADKTFKNSLKNYLNFIDEDIEDDEWFSKEDQKRRMDIFIAAKRPLELYKESSIAEENIIIELKSPHIVIDKEVFRQIEDYMDIIKKTPQFNSQTRNWSFYAISNSVDDFILEKYKENKNKGSQFIVKEVDNFRIYVMTWDDVFKSYEYRYTYLYQKLNFKKEELEIKLEKQMDKEKVDNLTREILRISS